MAVQIDDNTWDIQGRTIRFPVRVRDAGAAAAGFVVPIGPVRRLLAGTGLRPVGLAGRTLAILALIKYRESEGNDLGAYDEFGLIFLIKAPDGRFGAHVYQLPVSADFTREAGTEFWGYPKWLAEFSLNLTMNGGECRLSKQGESLLTMTVRSWKRPRLGYLNFRIAAYTVRGEQVHRCEAKARMTGVRFRLCGGVTATPGTATPGTAPGTATPGTASAETTTAEPSDATTPDRPTEADRQAAALPRELHALGLPRRAVFATAVERAELELFPAAKITAGPA